MKVVPADLVDGAAWTRATLAHALDRDWTRRAGPLSWSCAETLDHLVDCLLYYAVHLARRADRPVSQVRDGALDGPPKNLLGACTGAAAILAGVCASADASVRAYHPAGMADAEGFAAMGCDELLMHTFDIAEGLTVELDPPLELADRVRRRLFPWAPDGGDPWGALLWANGRTSLPGRDRLGADWSWLCAPLADWDGTRRTRPPGF